jgi:hypothetical protein
MNKVITINLDGTAFQLEEAGYNALHTYLETANARLEGNPDREEFFRTSNGRLRRSFGGF